MDSEKLKLVNELMGDTVPMPDPTAAETGRIAREQLERLGLKTVGEAGWLDVDNEAPPLRALLTVRDAKLGRKVPFMPAGKVGMLVAPGGTGKSQALVQLAVAVASGGPWLETYQVPTPGHVLLALGEEDYDEMHRRTRQAVDLAGWDIAEAVKENLHAVSLCGEPASFLDERGEEKDFYRSLRAGLAADPPVQWRLIILDPASRFLGPNAETDNAQATRFIEALERLTRLPGNPTVLIAHHANKSALAGSTDQGASRGSSALTDGVRWQANLERVTDPEPGGSGKRVPRPNQAILRVVKANHCPVQPELWLWRDVNRGGHLRPDGSPAIPKTAGMPPTAAAAGRKNPKSVTDSQLSTQKVAVVQADQLARQASALAAAETDQGRQLELEGKAKAAAGVAKKEKAKLLEMEAKFDLASKINETEATAFTGRDLAAGGVDDDSDL